MSTTIRVPIPDTLDLNGDGQVTLNEIVRSSYWVAVLVVICANVVNMALLFILWSAAEWEDWAGALRWSALVFGASIIVGAVWATKIGLNRARLPEWQKGHSEADLEIERELREWKLNNLKGTGNTRPGKLLADLDRIADDFLERSYEKGSFVTRGEWTEAGLAENDWNRVNKLFIDYGIRKGRSPQLAHEDSADAWRVWVNRTRKTNKWVRQDGDEEIMPG